MGRYSGVACKGSVFAPPSRLLSRTLSRAGSYQMCGLCVDVCPYLKTSGSGPIISREMVGISSLAQDLRWRNEREQIALGRWEELMGMERRRREGEDWLIRRTRAKRGHLEGGKRSVKIRNGVMCIQFKDFFEFFFFSKDLEMRKV